MIVDCRSMNVCGMKYFNRKSTIANYIVAAVEVFAHDLRDDRAQVAKFRFEFQGIDGQEIVKIPVDALPERRGPRLPDTVPSRSRSSG